MSHNKKKRSKSQGATKKRPPKTGESAADASVCATEQPAKTGGLNEWYCFRPWEGIEQSDLVDFAMDGDRVAQSYLWALRQAILPPRKNRLPVDYFERLLLDHIRRLNDMLCDLARAGHLGASHELWEQALKLTQAFSELALKNSAVFRVKARQSLYMPSLRTRNPAFTADATAIADAIQLGAASVGDKLTDNRGRLGALCARLVAECVHEIKLARDHWSRLYTQRQRAVTWPTREQIQPLLGKSVDEIHTARRDRLKQAIGNKDQLLSNLEFYCVLMDCGAPRLGFLILPELTTATAPIWWKDAIEKMAEARFPQLLEIPSWLEMLKAASTGTKADMLKELKDYSRDKVRQFA